MGVVKKKLPEFKGFAVQYDPAKKPFFVSMVLEDLRKIAEAPLGYQLLKAIADARPSKRSASSTSNAEAKKITFSHGINIVAVPTDMTFTQSGFKMDWSGVGVEKTMKPSLAAPHNVAGCPYHPAGGSCAEAADIIAAGDGTGSVSIMKYTNAQIITSKGEATQSFLVLAHELIHSLHHLQGTRKDTGEEDWTTGLGLYVGEPMSENAFRRAFGLQPRMSY